MRRLMRPGPTIRCTTADPAALCAALRRLYAVDRCGQIGALIAVGGTLAACAVPRGVLVAEPDTAAAASDIAETLRATGAVDLIVEVHPWPAPDHRA